MVDGRLDADVVAELERVIAELSVPVCLDLAGLKSADEAGLGVLRALLAHGVAVTGASPYFRLLLELEKPDQARKPRSVIGTEDLGRARRSGSPWE
jgi:ABC-type transporter Mla MlaB component